MYPQQFGGTAIGAEVGRAEARKNCTPASVAVKMQFLGSVAELFEGKVGKVVWGREGARSERSFVSASRAQMESAATG